MPESADEGMETRRQRWRGLVLLVAIAALLLAVVVILVAQRGSNEGALSARALWNVLPAAT